MEPQKPTPAAEPALSLHIEEVEMAEALNFDITKVGQLDTSGWFTSGEELIIGKESGLLCPCGALARNDYGTCGRAQCQ